MGIKHGYGWGVFWVLPLVRMWCCLIALCCVVAAWAPRIWALNCEAMKATVFQVMHERSFYKTFPMSPGLYRDILNEYIHTIDPYKSYFYADDISSMLTAHAMPKGGDWRGRMCEDVRMIGIVFRQRVQALNHALEAILDVVVAHNFSVNHEHVKFTVLSPAMPWAQNIPELVNRWQQRLIYERFKLHALSQKEALGRIRAFYEQYHELITHASYATKSFFRAYLSRRDLHARLLVEPLGRVRIANSFGYFYAPYVRLSTPGWSAAHLAMEYGVFETPHLVQEHFSLHSINPLVAGSFGLSTRDRVLNLFGSLYPYYLLLKHTGSETFMWQKLPKLSVHALAALMQDPSSLQYSLVEHSAKLAGRVRTKHADLSVAILHPYDVLPKISAPFALQAQELKLRLRTVLAEYKRTPTLGAMILDLRDICIHRLDFALVFLDALLPARAVIQVAKHSQNTIYATRHHHHKFQGSMVVLVNQGTCALAEVMAGVLQDYGRALILAQGSSSVQATAGIGMRTSTVVRTGIAEVRLQYADSVYVLPSGKIVEYYGIHPDIIVPHHVCPYKSPHAQHSQNFYRWRSPPAHKQPFYQDVARPLPRHIIHLLKKRAYARTAISSFFFDPSLSLLTYLQRSTDSHSPSSPCKTTSSTAVSLSWQQLLTELEISSSPTHIYPQGFRYEPGFLAHALLIAADFDHILRKKPLVHYRIHLER